MGTTPRRTAGSHVTPASLTDDSTGRWLVETQGGTLHVFDLDNDLYTRHSTQLERLMPFDDEPRALLDVAQWPHVHDVFRIVISDPDDEDSAFTQTSSFVRRIVPLPPDAAIQELPAMTLQQELTQLPPTNAWLVVGDDTNLPNLAEAAAMTGYDQWEPGLWTASRNTRRGDLVLVYITAPVKQVLYAARAASDAFFDNTIDIQGRKKVNPNQWWVELGQVVPVGPIGFQQVKEAMHGNLIPRGKPTHYLPPDVIEALFPIGTLSAEAAQVVQAPTGDPTLPDPASMTVDQWKNLSAGALKLEAEVELFIVNPLLAMISKGDWTIHRQYPVPGCRLRADYVICTADRPIAVLETKLGVRRGRLHDWESSPDQQQVTRYAQKLGGLPAVLIDANSIHLTDPGAATPWTSIDRTRATDADLDIIRKHLGQLLDQ